MVYLKLSLFTLQMSCTSSELCFCLPYSNFCWGDKPDAIVLVFAYMFLWRVFACLIRYIVLLWSQLYPPFLNGLKQHVLHMAKQVSIYPPFSYILHKTLDHNILMNCLKLNSLLPPMDYIFVSFSFHGKLSTSHWGWDVLLT